jgi:hypothetical protein
MEVAEAFRATITLQTEPSRTLILTENLVARGLVVLTQDADMPRRKRPIALHRPARSGMAEFVTLLGKAGPDAVTLRRQLFACGP